MNNRIQTIDVFRAITMFLMIFVNDFWTLTGIPTWLEHAKADQDFLGFSDIIFPTFLFIVGMSVPYAIKNRISKGDSPLKMFIHIVFRSVALLVMGFFTVNISNLNVQASGFSREAFQIIMVVAFFLIWNVYPKAEDWKKYLFMGLKGLGIVILLTLFFVFKGGKEGLQPMTPQWWGILGLIGWTYLITASIYLFVYKSPWTLVGFWVLFSLLNIADHAHWLKTPIPGGGAFQGLSFAGILASLLLDYFNKAEKHHILPLVYAGTGLLLFAAGLGLHQFFIISKILATPTWIYLCNAIAFGLLAVLFWIVDMKKKESWFAVIKPAGTSTLTCYLVPYVYYSLAVYAFSLPVFLKTGAIGLLKSAVYAFIVVFITALLGRLSIKLKI
jgi:predicted acyltransferase